MQHTRDYNIIKLRCHASKYHLKKWHDEDSTPEQSRVGHLKHIEAVQKYQDFFWKFINYLYGTSHDDYMEYMFSTIECLEEQMIDTHGIIRQQGGGWYTYLIPKDKPEIYQWVKDNKGDIPFKKLKRCSIMFRWYQPSTILRDEARERNAELVNKIKERKKNEGI